jgi:hypothetical protein
MPAITATLKPLGMGNFSFHLSLQSAHPIEQFPLKVVEDKHRTTGDGDVVATSRCLNR